MHCGYVCTLSEQKIHFRMTFAGSLVVRQMHVEMDESKRVKVNPPAVKPSLGAIISSR